MLYVLDSLEVENLVLMKWVNKIVDEFVDEGYVIFLIVLLVFEYVSICKEVFVSIFKVVDKIK